MSKFLHILSAVAVALSVVSCADQYAVRGSSSIPSLDGSKLYLKIIKDNELKNIDSCDVVHGEFAFSGTLDTVRVASLYMDDESLNIPVVLEPGEVHITIDRARRAVSGTALNDSLYQFIDRHEQLDNRMEELGHRQNQMILEGIDEAVIAEEIQKEAARIAAEEDQLVTNFIVENFDNVLGPFVFSMITNGFRYPVLTPQIEFIMSKATAKFKNDPYVKEYYATAQANEARMQGFDTATPSEPVAPAAPADTSGLATMPGSLQK